MKPVIIMSFYHYLKHVLYFLESPFYIGNLTKYVADPEIPHIFDPGIAKLFFALEMEVETPFGQSDGLQDLSERCIIVTVFPEQLRGFSDDAFSSEPAFFQRSSRHGIAQLKTNQSVSYY